MAHFAKIDENNLVVEVVVVPDSEEHRGNDYLNELGLVGTWIQASVTNSIRGVFAVRGMSYLPEVDKFMPFAPAGNPSFVFDTEAWKWVPPIELPSDADWVIDYTPAPEFTVETVDCETCPSGTTEIYKPILPDNAKIYFWDEDSVSWKLAPNGSMPRPS